MITLNVLDKDGLTVVTHPLDAAVVEPLLTALCASPSVATNGFSANTKFVAKASAGKLLGLRVTNANAAARYVQIHNVTAVPTGGTVPSAYTFLVPAGTTASPGVLFLGREFFREGVSFATGITVTLSTTQGTFTDSATASEHQVHAHYV